MVSILSPGQQWDEETISSLPEWQCQDMEASGEMERGFSRRGKDRLRYRLIPKRAPWKFRDLSAQGSPRIAEGMLAGSLSAAMIALSWRLSSCPFGDISHAIMQGANGQILDGNLKYCRKRLPPPVVPNDPLLSA